MEHVARRNAARTRTSWSSIAFIVESILLLVFLAASLAVLTKVFSASLNASIESRTLDAATIAAGSIAEHFSADPANIEERTELGDLLIECDVTPEQRTGGTLYHATINVYDKTGAHGPDPVYTLETARYMSNPAIAETANAGAANAGAANATSPVGGAAAPDESDESSSSGDSRESGVQ